MYHASLLNPNIQCPQILKLMVCLKPHFLQWNSDQCGSQPSNEYGHRFGGGATDSQKIIKHRSATGTIQDHPKKDSKLQSCACDG